MERDEAIRAIESNWPHGRIMICEALTMAIADMRATAQAQATAPNSESAPLSTKISGATCPVCGRYLNVQFTACP